MKKKKSFQKILIIFCLLCLYFIAVFSLVKCRNEKNKSFPNNGKQSSSNTNNFPVLSLNPDYFSEKDYQWGNVNQDNPEKYDSVAVNGEDSYRSYPTTTTTVKDYSTDIQPLSKPATLSEVLKDQRFSSWAKENYQKYGQLSLNYLPEKYIVTREDFDVDNDKKKEAIVSLGLMGANHPPQSIDIIKDQKVIFHTDSFQPQIVKSQTNNGFYLLWHTDKQYEKGMCCPSGIMKTRFVFKEGKFVPVWEQEIVYVSVSEGK